jgi:glycosyltransferase involved in cell wall biosynthesis
MLKPIRIFVDGHCFDTPYQGTQTFLKGVYTAMMMHYPAVEMYFGAGNPDHIAKAFPLLPASHILPYRFRRPSILRYATDIPRLLRQHAFDVAHFQYQAPRPVAHCRYIVTVHDVLFNDFPETTPWWYRLSRNRLFKRGLQRASVKTTVSEYSRQRLSHWYAFSQEELIVLPNGISCLPVTEGLRSAARENLSRAMGIADFILCVSRIEPRKNHLLLLEAWLELELYRKDIPLVFVGDHTLDVPALTKRIAGLSPAQRARFFWWKQVEPTVLEQLYLAARCMVYPSAGEGFGLPPLEAAALHTPVLCANTTAMAAYDFFAPYHINPGEPGALAHALTRMLVSPPTVAQRAAIAATICERYSWQKTASLLHRLITQTPAT